ncbi:hypothetical protein BDV40DRAFT_281844 [Aspergillus tamarii]|uniref:Uncharacterized protein n=1 Tax=Aspergillus tamarii TaxID=41984 RepID=A0A5N6UDI4_ASPTM|nr:hypothetical protein BDV40DRAFT_281844 [Aspergillus tamarii]
MLGALCVTWSLFQKRAILYLSLLVLFLHLTSLRLSSCRCMDSVFVYPYISCEKATPFTYVFCGRLTEAIDIRIIRVLAPRNSQIYACTLDIPRSTSYIHINCAISSPDRQYCVYPVQ